MPSAFHFIPVLLPGPGVYQVWLDGPASRLLGSVTAIENGWWQASVVVVGKLYTQPFPDRERAAAGLLSIAPRMKR